MTVKAHWTGAGSSRALENWEQRKLGLGTDDGWYRFSNEPHNRLTLHYAGVQYRVQDETLHNYNSIPWIFGAVPFIGKYFRKDSYPRSPVFHDAAYGEEHTLWISRDGGETWNKEQVTKEIADLLLRVGIIAEEGPEWVANTYYRMVSAFGRFCW